MAHAAPLPFLRETLLFLALAGVLIPLLQRFRINQVSGFLDAPEVARLVVQAARRQSPDLRIYVRCRDEQHASALRAAGATAAVPEMLEAGLLLGALALESIRLPEGDVAAAVDAERERRHARFR